VQDNSGRENDRAIDTAEVTVVEVPNIAPIADAGGDRAAIAGDIITFHAGASRDPDGTIVAYRWDFGNGAGAAGEVARYALPAAGHLHRHADRNR
jgi:hypothetical protein